MMINAIYLTIAIILFLLVISAFFSGAETALTAASRAQLRAMADKGDKRAARALEITENRERLIGAILLGNNFVNILATSIASALLSAVFSDSGVVWATFIMTAMILIFAEVLPKTYAISHSEAVARRIAPAMAIIVIILTPIVRLVEVFVNIILRLFGYNGAANMGIAAHEEIASAIQMHHFEGGVEKDDRDRLLGALDLSRRTVEEIMKHRSDLQMIDKNAPPQDILEQCLASPYTRLPIYEGESENIVGVLHAKDLLREINNLVRISGRDLNEIDQLDIMKIATEPYFVPETTMLDEQMQAFLSRKAHFALIVDEYGALQGLITLEDILEEIVGEISDEHDEDQEQFEQRADGAYILDGAMTIRDANRIFDWNIPDEEAYTIAGIVIHEAQIIPKQGQEFRFLGYNFQIIEREKNRITKIAVWKDDETW